MRTDDEVGVGFDEGLLAEILAVRRLQEHNWDAVVVITGLEGSGKSTLGPLLARVVDKNWYDAIYALQHTVFSDEEFNDILLTAKPGSAIIWDEAGYGTDSKQVMTKTNMIVENNMQRIRKNRLFIIMIRSVFFDFTKYMAIHRSCALINVYAMRYDDRGYYDFYGREAKKHLYLAGKKTWNMKAAQPNWKGRFKNIQVWNDDAYQAKKDKATQEFMKHSGRVSNKDDTYRLLWLMMVEKLIGLGVTQKEIASVCNMTPSALNQQLKWFHDLIKVGGMSGSNERNKRLVRAYRQSKA